MDRPAHKTAIQLFGRFEIRRGDGGAVQLKSKKGRALLGYLAMHLDQPVPRSRIASLLWEDQPEKMGRQNLRQILAELREEVGLDFDGGISKEMVQLDSRHFDVDAVRFLACARNQSDPATAVALYTGDLTADLEIRSAGFDEWLSLERRRLHSLALDIFGARVEALDAAGDKKQALIVCERLLALDPLRETTHRLLLPLEAAVNGRGSALARAEALTKILREQLGVSPEPATKALISALTNAVEPRPHVAFTASKIASSPPRPARKRYLATATAIAILLTGAAGWYFGPLNGERSALEEPKTAARIKPRPGVTYAIVVIPFTARNEAAHVKRFTNALEEDVIDTLSRAPRIFVISRQTSRSYRDTDKDARDIGKELDVDFLLSGNVDVDGDKLFVRAQLTDTKSGLQVWSDRFMHTTDAPYGVFEEIVLAVARQLHIHVLLTEATRRIQAEGENPDYRSLIDRGWVELYRSFTDDGHLDLALELFEKAAALEPRHITARIGIASVLTRRVADLKSPDRAADIKRTETLLTQILLEHPENSSAYFFMGIVRKLQGRNAESVVQFEKALRFNPSHAHAYAQLGHTFILLGRAAEAEPNIRKAIRLSPKEPTISSWYLFAGQADLQLRRYKEATRWLEMSVEVYPRSGRTHIFLAAAHMLNGDTDEAVKAARTALKYLPNFTVDGFRKQTGDGPPEYFAERERINDAIERALVLARRT